MKRNWTRPWEDQRLDQPYRHTTAIRNVRIVVSLLELPWSEPLIRFLIVLNLFTLLCMTQCVKIQNTDGMESDGEFKGFN